jgi:NRPS condensation-like uncharacterized protein
MNMKIKFQFGNIKVHYEDKFENNIIKTNPFLSAFLKPNSDVFNKISKNPLTDSLNNYYEIYNNYLKSLSLPKPSSNNIAYELGNLPANGHDIYNYVARYGIANFHLQAIMKLNGQLDFDKLLKAVRLSVDAEPVFGCRFIENDPPYWKRLNNIDSVEFCTFEETDDSEKSVQQFLETPLDMDKDPMVRVKLIRSDANDIVCVKLNHACCDGTGTKEYIQLLADIYSQLYNEDSDFAPKQGTRSRKDQDRLFAELDISNPDALWIPGSDMTRATWTFPWKQIQTDIPRIVVCRLPEGQLENLTNYVKVRGGTINDLILTAYYRAMRIMGRSNNSDPMEISVTIDLRRYLPDHKTEQIRNFSGSEPTSVSMKANESFNETLYKVIATMKKIKQGRPGLQSAIGLERIEKLPWNETLSYYKMLSLWPTFCCDKCAPVLSNLGIISESSIKFGDNEVIDAYIVPPVVRSPGFLLIASTYNGVLSLSAGYYEASIPREDIEKLLNKIKDELMKCE